MKRGKNIGIWIDSKDATIIELGGENTKTKTLHSNLNSRPRFGGETSLKPKGRISSASDYKHSPEIHYENEMKKFLNNVLAEVKDADNLYIFGPAETRIKLESTVKRSNKKAHVLKVEPCDKISEAQKIKRVKEFFTSLT
jgi:hypothetical protein